jgi:hypothetical protein
MAEHRHALYRMWEELDAITERLMAGPDVYNDDDRGRALGVATCIAYFYPSNKGLPWVRQEAMARWKQANR